MVRLFFIVLAIIVFVVILLFLPIYVKADTHYDMNGRKLAFSLSLYRYIRVFGGYIATYPGGFAIHTSPKKAILISYGELNTKRDRLSILKSVKLKEFNTTVETGAEYLLATSVVHTILRVIFFILGGKKEKIENNVWLRDGDMLRISGNVTITFSLFAILRNILAKK